LTLGEEEDIEAKNCQYTTKLASVDETQTEIAKNAIFAGLADELIIQITGLTIEQLEKLRTELGK
jgi:hypothetical protein